MREPDLWRRFLQIFYKLFQAQSMEIYIVMLRMLEHLLFNLCFDSQLSLHCVWFLAEAHQEKKVVKRVPKGTSDYQAAWITNSDDEEGPDDDDNDEDDDEFEEEMEGSDSDDSMVICAEILFWRQSSMLPNLAPV